MIGYHNVDLGDRLTSFQFLYASRNVIKKVYLPTFVMDLRESRENVREEELCCMRRLNYRNVAL